MEKIDKSGAGFRSVTQHVDATTPAGRMMMQMLGSFAEFERSMIRERTRAGPAAAKEDGRVGGRRRSLNDKQRREIADAVLSGRKCIRQQRVAAARHAFVGRQVPALRVHLPLVRISILSPCVSCSCVTTCHGVSKYQEGDNFAFVTSSLSDLTCMSHPYACLTLPRHPSCQDGSSIPRLLNALNFVTAF